MTFYEADQSISDHSSVDFGDQVMPSHPSEIVSPQFSDRLSGINPSPNGEGYIVQL